MAAYRRENSTEEALLGFFGIVAGGLLILIQWWLFATGAWGLIRTVPLNRQDYANYHFAPAGFIVFFVSAICAFIWHRTALRWSKHIAEKRDMRAARFRWVSISCVVILSFVFVCLLIGNVSPEALPWFAGFLIVDMVVIYWLSTALSTPDRMVPAVPLADRLRK